MADQINAAERSTHPVAVANIAAQQLDVGIEIARPGGLAVNLRVQIIENPDTISGAQKFPGEV
jgi:hypothetical protein